jgi:hypothetical protein
LGWYNASLKFLFGGSVYFSYDRQLMVPLYKHQNFNVICDLLHIEGRDSFSIIPLGEKRLFAEHSAVELKKLYLGLGGDAEWSCVQNGAIYGAWEEVRQECQRLAFAYPTTECNGFEVGLQAAWVDNVRADTLLIKCGYQYQQGAFEPMAV